MLLLLLLIATALPHRCDRSKTLCMHLWCPCIRVSSGMHLIVFHEEGHTRI